MLSHRVLGPTDKALPPSKADAGRDRQRKRLRAGPQVVARGSSGSDPRPQVDPVCSATGRHPALKGPPRASTQSQSLRATRIRTYVSYKTPFDVATPGRATVCAIRAVVLLRIELQNADGGTQVQARAQLLLVRPTDRPPSARVEQASTRGVENDTAPRLLPSRSGW